MTAKKNETMNDFDKLKDLTSIFFSLFWNEGLGKEPQWSEEIWEFNGTLPNHDKKGCYAHFDENELVYIGLGISNSFDGSGIGARVSKYWKKNPNKTDSNKQYIPTVEGVTGVRTLSFPNDYFYLAAALEIYLIGNIPNLKKNKVHKKIS